MNKNYTYSEKYITKGGMFRKIVLSTLVALPLDPYKNDLFIRPTGVRIPDGWTDVKVDEHMQRIRKTVFEHKYKTQQNFGRSTLVLKMVSDRSYVAKYIMGIDSSIPFEEWVDAINYAIEAANVYIDPAHEFAVYATY